MVVHEPDSYCVLGLGRTGASVARWLLKRRPGAGIWVYGGASADETDVSRELAELGAHVVLGTEEVADPAAPGPTFGLAVVSPGIPPASAFFQSAEEASEELVGEPELAWRVSPDRWVGITGTNGKTTTTTLMAHLIQAAGMPARTVGNIGTPAIECVDDRAEGEWFCAELSSFQLQTAKELRPVTACLLNVTPDHVDWHGSLEAYAAAKERIFQNFGPGQLAVVSEEDDFCRAICARLEARGVRVCRVDVHAEPDSTDAAFVCDGRLVVRLEGRELLAFPVENLTVQGDHNAQNALAASAMALSIGIPADDVAQGLASFSPLEHRIEPCGELGGVRFVNDSKATNTDSVEKALTAFPTGTVCLLLGGHDKGTDLASMAAAVAARCRVAVCFGEAGERMACAVEGAVEATGSSCQVVRAPHMEQALDAAIGLALPGDAVLLSPACSSFDEFSNFVERGRTFKRLVAERIQAGGSR